jgi:hypothetical protein
VRASSSAAKEGEGTIALNDDGQNNKPSCDLTAPNRMLDPAQSSAADRAPGDFADA